MFTAAGKSAAVSAANYIEEVFSTFLYTGNSSTQTITNGIDLAGKGGLVWTKARSAAYDHELYDTVRGVNRVLISNSTAASANSPNSLTAFNSTGFTLGANNSANSTGITGVSWTFRKQARFFDVVTYTGDGSGSQAIPHSLASQPGFILIKRTDNISNWVSLARSDASNYTLLFMNLTNATAEAPIPQTSAASSTNLNVGYISTKAGVNTNGATYVAYLFAHDAGGFGPAGTDNVISCGSFVDNVDTNINLGYEPQWILVKSSSNASQWYLLDTMRGWTTGGNTKDLLANSSAAETTDSVAGLIAPTATGFKVSPFFNATWIYIAIRRGPMKTPTSGTSVFSPNLAAAQGQLTTGFPVDLGMWNYTPGYSENTVVNDRLRGVSSTNSVTNANNLITSSTVAEQASQGTRNWNNTGLYAVTGSAVFYSFRRAPGFFDVVCYTGTGGGVALNHNLGVVPELAIYKARSSSSNWFGTYVINPAGGVNTAITGLSLNSTSAPFNFNAGSFGGGGFTATTFPSTGAYDFTGNNLPFDVGVTYVAYLFASVAGVSKVGRYTGTGALQTINCGFAAGARFVLIKRTDSTGDWYVWDSARGISSSTDPYLTLNTTAAEVTSTNWVDTASTGFQVTAAGGNLVNTNGASYIFLSVA